MWLGCVDTEQGAPNTNNTRCVAAQVFKSPTTLWEFVSREQQHLAGSDRAPFGKGSRARENGTDRQDAGSAPCSTRKSVVSEGRRALNPQSG